ncbi:MAG: hypothetical protein BME94_05045 [Methanobacteriales archaeon Met13]
MSLKLNLLSLWMPEFVIKKELKLLGDVTIGELDRLLQENAPSYLKSVKRPVFEGDSTAIRAEIASAHNKRVNLLVDSLGRDKAIQLGREALFIMGKDLGSQIKNRIGVGKSLKELIKAASILYRVLGIAFKVKKINGDIFMVVNRCSLARHYSPETCLILSAADEGVVKGLNPKIKIKFTERIADGAACCLASIQVEE